MRSRAVLFVQHHALGSLEHHVLRWVHRLREVGWPFLIFMSPFLYVPEMEIDVILFQFFTHFIEKVFQLLE